MDRHHGRTHVHQTEMIRHLNDRLRSTGQGGRTVITRATGELPAQTLAELLLLISRFEDVAPRNDRGERDFGSVECDGEPYFWKIDYYDVNLEFGSPDPADDTVTCRVMTIMTASDL